LAEAVAEAAAASTEVCIVLVTDAVVPLVPKKLLFAMCDYSS
jgi:2-C-methyl-D-erythritol 4-phosphate cytidylyltransferase